MTNVIKFIVFMAFSTAAFSDLSLVGGGYSYHTIKGEVTNQSHDLWAVKYKSIIAGRFNNSFDRESYFIAKEWTWRPFESAPNIQTFTWGGLTKGYRSCSMDNGTGNSKLCLLAVPGIRYTLWDLQPSVVFMYFGFVGLLEYEF